MRLKEIYMSWFPLMPCSEDKFQVPFPVAALYDPAPQHPLRNSWWIELQEFRLISAVFSVARLGEIEFPPKLLATAPVGHLMTAHLTQDG